MRKYNFEKNTHTFRNESAAGANSFLSECEYYLHVQSAPVRKSNCHSSENECMRVVIKFPLVWTSFPSLREADNHVKMKVSILPNEGKFTAKMFSTNAGREFREPVHQNTLKCAWKQILQASHC